MPICALHGRSCRSRAVAVPPPVPKATTPSKVEAAKTEQPQTLAEVFAKIGHRFESAWKEQGGYSAALQNIVKYLGGIGNTTPQAQAEVANLQAKNADAMGWGVTETPKAAETKAPETKAAETKLDAPLLSETSARIDAAMADWVADKSEAGAII